MLTSFAIATSTTPNASVDGKTEAAASQATIQWYPYEAGLVRAEKLDKKVFLYFFTDRCFYCKIMDQKTFTDQATIAYVNDNFVPIRLNSDQNAALATQYQVPGVPISIFMEDDSEMIGAKPGYVPPEDFLKMLQFVDEELYKKE